MVTIFRLIASLSFISLSFGYNSAISACDDEGKCFAKHIILFIGDGMHLEYERAASRYLYGEDFSLSFHSFPYKGNVSTWDVTTYNKFASKSGKPLYDPLKIIPDIGYDSGLGGRSPHPLQEWGIDDAYFIPKDGSKPFATDSASAATAWATGYKTDDGNIAWLPGDPDAGGNRNNDGSLKTIAELLREVRDYAMGVVSTVPYSHATPAAHVSHNKSRNSYNAIADEIIRTTKPEVVIGGGHPSWNSGFMSTGLYNDVKNNVITDYVFVERTSGVDGGPAILSGADQAILEGKKLFGLFGGAGGNFEPPVPSDRPGFPNITRTNIENPLLKDATIAALKVLGQDPDGFFLMVEQGDIDWANHANDYQWMIGTMWDLNGAVEAAIEYVNKPNDGMNWCNTLLIVTADHANSYMRLNKITMRGDLPNQTAFTGACTDGHCPSYKYPDREVSYSSSNHTNELVRLYAVGQGSLLFSEYEGDWYPCTSIIDNAHIFHVIAEAAKAPRKSPLNVITQKPSLCYPILWSRNNKNVHDSSTPKEGSRFPLRGPSPLIN
jgi:alkaline phosphatase